MKKQKNEIFNITKEEKKDLSGLKYTRRVLKYIKFPKLIFTLLMTVYIIGIAISLIEALLSREMILIVAASEWEKLPRLALIFFGLGTLRLLSGYADSYLATKFNTENTRNLSIVAYERVNSMSAECFVSSQSSTFVRRIGESGTIANFIIDSFKLLYNIITELAYSIVFLITTPILFSVLAVFYVIRAIVMRTIIPKYQAIRKKNHELFDKSYNIKLESIRGALDIKALNISDNFMKKYLDVYNRGQDNQLSINIWYRNRTTPTNFFTTTLNALIFMLLAAHFGIKGTFTAGAILFAWTNKGYVAGLFSNLLSIREHFSGVEMAASRYMELFDETKYPIEKFGDKTIDISGNIEFKNVTFYYDKKSPVLNDVSFNIDANKITAFVGKTGCGKSTTLSLIAKFYDVKKGKIYIDGTNVKKLSKDCLRNNITYVQQTPYIFNATFKENLLYVKPDATDEELIEACKRSEIHDFIMTTDNGYDTLLGENGINLSGGQRQRLAIARAFLSNAKIIMFDESTSSLDNDNQAKIQKAIDNLAKDHTIIVVAHRLSTIINADKIIMIDDHKVVAQGTHKSLMKNCKEYSALYALEENKE